MTQSLMIDNQRWQRQKNRRQWSQKFDYHLYEYDHLERNSFLETKFLEMALWMPPMYLRIVRFKFCVSVAFYLLRKWETYR